MKNFLKFIEDTPTAYHAAKKIKTILSQNGFCELQEQQEWKLKKGGKYFIGRNMSSVLAFVIPNTDVKGYNVAAAHLDSPTFKLKPNFCLERGNYQSLNVEVYGGPIFSTWMDRPLGIAGRVFIKEKNQILAKLIDLNKGIAVIPNMPIHYNREVNKGVELNPQIDMLPLFQDTNIGNADLYDFIAKEINIKKEDILSSDLYLTNLDRGRFIGLNEEFILAPQIDDLECAYGILQAFLNSTPKNTINLCVLFDDEEIGSSTTQGADGTMLDVVMRRIATSLSKTEEEYYQMLAHSFMVSADNAQGFHPNHPEKYDKTNACYLNQGIVIKNAARGSYSTDGLSSAYFQAICLKANVKVQKNTNRSDILGGSTLGSISLRHVSIPSVDIGLAELAMHSAYETAGSLDLKDFIQAMKEFYNSSFDFTNEEKIIL